MSPNMREKKIELVFDFRGTYNFSSVDGTDGTVEGKNVSGQSEQKLGIFPDNNLKCTFFHPKPGWIICKDSIVR
jgi:hypothetical protein